jgi:6-phosphogluconolactonase (cycloisomerase 2 family)
MELKIKRVCQLTSASSSVPALSLYDLNIPQKLAEAWAEYFWLPHPGVVPGRQDAAHLHETILDPTGKFLLVPDLGSDLVRVFHITSTKYFDFEMQIAQSLVVAPGSGPRHGTFLKLGSKTLFYLISELANTITTYDVAYGAESLNFTLLTTISTHGPGASVPAGTTAAEITVSVSISSP